MKMIAESKNIEAKEEVYFQFKLSRVGCVKSITHPTIHYLSTNNQSVI